MTRLRPRDFAVRLCFLLLSLGTPVPLTAAEKAVGDAPIIDTQPIARTVTDGGHASLSVALSQGAAPISFQWWQNQQPLRDSARVTGATNPVLNIDPVQSLDSGSYFITVSNSSGATTSAAVSLVVSQLVFNFTPVGGTGAWLNIFGQIGDVYRIEVNTNFTGYRTAGYATNATGQARYFDYDPGTGFRQVRVRFNHMLPVLSLGESNNGVTPLLAKAAAAPTVLAYGKLNQIWRFESSANFIQWFPLATVTNTTGWVRFIDPTIDPGDVVPPHRFYRIAPP